VPKPWSVDRTYEAVISSANQARVTIYAIDASGLRVASPNSAVAADINTYGNGRMDELGTAAERSSPPKLIGFEAMETSIRSNPQVSLGRLAKETGGYLVSDTNAIAPRLRQVDEDLRTYYEVSYSPKNTNYDGSFRRVAVTVHRSGVSVKTREGYYAINVVNAPPVLPYEAPAVAAATAKVARTDFAIHALAASFPDPARPGLVPVIVSVPASVATFMQSAKRKMFATAFSVVVLARDEAGQIVAKTSREYVLTGPLDQMEASRRGELLYYADLDLAPGRYTIDAVGYDAPTHKASVRHLPLVVASTNDEGPRLSSLTIVERAEEVKGTDNVKGEPFRVGNALLYPNLGTPLKKTADGKLAFYVTAYVAHGQTQAPQASVEVAQNGRSLARVPMELPAPDADGRIQYTNAVPLSAFPPGSYELRVTVTDGTHSVTRTARFTVTV
jgi:hypothetical protein